MQVVGFTVMMLDYHALVQMKYSELKLMYYFMLEGQEDRLYSIDSIGMKRNCHQLNIQR